MCDWGSERDSEWAQWANETITVCLTLFQWVGKWGHAWICYGASAWVERCLDQYAGGRDVLMSGWPGQSAREWESWWHCESSSVSSLSASGSGGVNGTCFAGEGTNKCTNEWVGGWLGWWGNDWKSDWDWWRVSARDHNWNEWMVPGSMCDWGSTLGCGILNERLTLPHFMENTPPSHTHTLTHTAVANGTHRPPHSYSHSLTNSLTQRLHTHSSSDTWWPPDSPLTHSPTHTSTH